MVELIAVGGLVAGVLLMLRYGHIVLACVAVVAAGIYGLLLFNGQAPLPAPEWLAVAALAFPTVFWLVAG